MMYAGLPKRERRAVQIALALGWAFATASGLSASLNPTSRVLLEMGPGIAVPAGALLAISSVVGVLGVVTGRYRFEWVAGWLAAAAAVPYAATVWSLTITVNSSWVTAACNATVALVFYASRALLCAAHAAKLRQQHRASVTLTAAIERVQGEVEADVDGDARD